MPHYTPFILILALLLPAIAAGKSLWHGHTTLNIQTQYCGGELGVYRTGAPATKVGCVSRTGALAAPGGCGAFSVVRLMEDQRLVVVNLEFERGARSERDGPRYCRLGESLVLGCLDVHLDWIAAYELEVQGLEGAHQGVQRPDQHRGWGAGAGNEGGDDFGRDSMFSLVRNPVSGERHLVALPSRSEAAEGVYYIACRNLLQLGGMEESRVGGWFRVMVMEDIR